MINIALEVKFTNIVKNTVFEVDTMPVTMQTRTCLLQKFNDPLPLGAAFDTILRKGMSLYFTIQRG